ncbi:cyanobacterial porin [[Leptolyngbya] sp. PCC 7376]|uniref:iron uptake porin n=1 Tax=[Leptolyngbya] sp. PCC 7376 TaxID=111781 RepID=UPI00029F3175|nr:iron uptake porin [[Leptolyngbya] sp. PCC 7376]AFY38559.1 cyanobacterial porin [[Leptolyngbya] sp. PCC 7376]
MNYKFRWKSPLLAFTFILSGGALVQAQAESVGEQLAELENYGAFTTEEETLEVSSAALGQINNIFQLRDVAPSDWAFDALRNLVEKYNCLVGYPDGTFRGDRPLSRYEFAAGLNACLEQINRLYLGDTSSIDAASVNSIRQLVSEFEAELATLGARVDDLDGRVSELEDYQFSTTTKLYGQTVFGIQGRNSNEYTFFRDRLTNEDNQINTITNTQLSLFTQFSPNSILLTGLSAGSGSTTPSNRTLQPFVALGYEADSGNDIQISDLTYRHLISDKLALIVGTEGVSATNIFRGANRVQSAGYGPLSRFAQRNPVINIGGSGSGFGLDWQIANSVSLQALYSTNLAENSTFGGLFGGELGSTTFGTQLVASPSRDLDFTFQYMNSYSPWGTLSGNPRPSGIGDDQVVIQDLGSGRAPISTNAFGLAMDWRVTPKFNVGGWAGYTDSEYQAEAGDVETFNWMAYMTFPDLGKKGSLGGIFFGQPPKITSSNLPDGRNLPSLISRGDFTAGTGGQPDTTTHLEAFYRFNVTDNIALTPGFIAVFNPLHNDDNETITIGVLRTTVSF